MNEVQNITDNYGASMKRRSDFMNAVGLKGFYEIICKAPNGKIKWKEDISNLVVTEGRNHALSISLDGGTQITTWYVGLSDGTPTVAAGDVMSSHAGWVEVQAYDESVRQTWTGGSVASGSVDNSAAVATFTIDTNSTTIGGAFLVSISTKGATTGTLYSAGAFTGGDKSADDNDTLEVTATFTATSS